MPNVFFFSALLWMIFLRAINRLGFGKNVECAIVMIVLGDVFAVGGCSYGAGAQGTNQKETQAKNSPEDGDNIAGASAISARHWPRLRKESCERLP
jgi:hypothetical protein